MPKKRIAEIEHLPDYGVSLGGADMKKEELPRY